MKIHVQHNGEECGPYSLDEVRASLRARALSRDDLAWHEGLDAWKPLGGVLFDLHRSSVISVTALAVEPQNAASANVTRQASSRTSRRGILFAGGVLALVALSLTGWRFFASREQGRTNQDSPSPAPASGYDAHPIDTSTQKPPTLEAATKPATFDLVSLAKQTRNAVVLIEVFDASNKKTATGSGFFISSDGLLITNYHVIEGAESAVAKFANGGLFPIVGARAVDRDNDLVLLATEGKNLPFLNLRDSADIEPGTRIAVMGNPRGLEGSLSEGIVSAKRDGAAEHKWLQITAAISPGSSGSPVVDASGSVLGIATMVITSGQSLNFAVPSEAANALWNKAKSESTLTPLAMLKEEASDLASHLRDEAMHSPECEAAIKAIREAETASALAELAKKQPQRDGVNGQRTPAGDTISRDWNTALAAANALIAKYPRFEEGYWYAGRAYSAMGFTDDAITAFQKAVKISPTNDGLWDELANLSRKKGGVTGAIAVFQRAVKANPASSFSWCNLASLYKENGEVAHAGYAFSQAIELCQKEADRPLFTISKDPEVLRHAREEKALALIGLGSVYRDAGRIEDAIRAYQRAENEGEMKFSEWHMLGGFYRDLGRPDDAMRAYQAEMKILGERKSGPYLVEEFYGLARLYAEQGKIEKAADLVHQVFPNERYSRAWGLVAGMLADKQQELAIKCMKKSDELKAQGK